MMNSEQNTVSQEDRKTPFRKWQICILILIVRHWANIMPFVAGVWTRFARALRFVLLTWISARAQGFEKNKHGACWRPYSDHFILFREDCACVFSVLTSKQFVMRQKRLFFNVFKVILLENTLPFWDCLYGSRSSLAKNVVRMRCAKKSRVRFPAM